MRAHPAVFGLRQTAGSTITLQTTGKQVKRPLRPKYLPTRVRRLARSPRHKAHALIDRAPAQHTNVIYDVVLLGPPPAGCDEERNPRVVEAEIAVGETVILLTSPLHPC